MLVKLLKNAKIWHKAGEIVEVSPDECCFLTTTGGAVVVEAVKDAVETPEKVVKAETPEKKTKKTTKKK